MCKAVADLDLLHLTLVEYIMEGVSYEVAHVKYTVVIFEIHHVMESAPDILVGINEIPVL